MRRNIYTILMAFLVLSMLIPIHLNIRNANAEIEGFESNITDDSLPQGKPAMYGNRVVWAENTLEGGITNWEIFLYDLSMDSDNDTIPNYLENSSTGYRPTPDPAKIRITNNTSYQLSPKIYGDVIIWEDKRHGNWDIYMYDLAEDSDGDGVANYLDDDDDNDGTSDENDTDSDPAEIRITNHPAHQEEPDIYGSKIVWEDARYGNKDVFLFDLISLKEYVIVGLSEMGDAKNRPWQRYPRIYGDKIVWQDDRFASLEICMYNLSTDTDDDGVPNYIDDDRPDPDPAEKRITSNSEPDFNPSVYGYFIVYARSDNVFLYDLRENLEFKLTDSLPKQKIDSGPNIYGTKVVWSYDINNSKDLYLYDLALDSDDDGEPNYLDADTASPDPALARLTNESERFSMISSIYTNKIVWQDSRNQSSPIEVYLFTLTQNRPPEITDFLPDYTAEIEEGESLIFKVTAVDPEDGELTYMWFLDKIKLQGEETDTYNYISDFSSAGIHEIKVIVSDSEFPVEKVWLVFVAESGIEPLEIIEINPAFNPMVIEGGEITLSIRTKYLGSGEPITTWTAPGDSTFGVVYLDTNTSLISPPIDYNGSNDIKYFSITFNITDGKYSASHTWLVTILYFEDADMDGYSDSYEVTWNSDPLDRTSTPTDLDKDFIVDAEDDDKDGDGFLDKDDKYPLDPKKQLDEKSDNIEEMLLIIIILILLVVAFVTLPKISKS
ncbi:MAG: hypothetical protein JSV09_16450 [Thermoplasmata archaeon]|nr:MAG: hypothetical protein JSV09_16450 [Thermoplasmata archaeon]